MKNKVVYLHRKSSNNQVFYVGIGSVDRPYVIQGRSNIWHNTVAKHGLSVDIVRTNLSSSEAQQWEIKLIKKYGRKDKGLGPLVNLTDGGDGLLNPTKEQIEKRIKKVRKPISAYNLKGEFVSDFRSTKEASRVLGLQPHSITMVLKGDRIFASNYLFTYKDEIPKKTLKEWAKSMDIKSDRINIFKMYTLEGVFVKEFFRLHEAANYIGLKSGDKIKKVLDKSLNGSKRVLTAGNHIWIYSDRATKEEIQSRIDEIQSYKRGTNLKELDNRKRIQCTSKDGSIVKSFNSLQEAAEFLGLKGTTGISHCLSGRQNTSHGFKWEYL
ncbi:NUMOD1 domain-containing DNA-binding protein [Crocinitomicaceae bacterium]|nr:NUMOD1 domain-containing DNA-binding protein [Crocinitomicaceae bacterium]